MADTADISRFVVIGANHRSSGAGLRERLYFDEAAQPAFLARLRSAGLAQALVLSTCDRVEVECVHDDAARAADIVFQQFGHDTGLNRAALEEQCYALTGRAALRHLFGVAASLDSLIVGEPQVLGQVKDSHRFASEAGMMGAELDAMLQAAYRAAKRVRTETAIGERPVSIAAAAERIAHNLHGALDGCTTLLVGTGEMGTLIADHLRRAGIADLVVTARIGPQAEAVARRLGGHHAPWDDLAATLVEADIVITAVASGRHVVTRPMVEAALAARRRRPVFLIDAAVPGDVQPAVNDLDDAFLYDLGDLETIALEGLARRDSEAAAAERIVDDEVARFLRERQAREASPLVAALRRHFEAQRLAALDDAPGNADAATRLLVNRLLHGPSAGLRRLAEAGIDTEEAERLLSLLFEVGDGDDDDDEGTDR